MQNKTSNSDEEEDPLFELYDEDKTLNVYDEKYN